MEQESQQQTQQAQQQQQQQQQGAERDVELEEAGPSFKPLEGPSPLQVCSPARVGSCISWPMLRTHTHTRSLTPPCAPVSACSCACLLEHAAQKRTCEPALRVRDCRAATWSCVDPLGRLPWKLLRRCTRLWSTPSSRRSETATWEFTTA